MNKTLVLLIIFLLLLIGVGVAGYIAYKRIQQKVRSFSNSIFGTNSIKEGFEQIELEYSVTPKSVSAATSLFLPQITKDFPDFHYPEMKEKAENALIKYLRAIDSLDSSLFDEGTKEMKEKLSSRIAMYKEQGAKPQYNNIKIHRTEIAEYKKHKGVCSIVFQSAVEYSHFIEVEEKVTSGRKDLKTQSKYNIVAMYIQNRELAENDADAVLGHNCPNCAAPLSGVGDKVCAYCGTPITEFNIRVWHFGEIKEI